MKNYPFNYQNVSDKCVNCINIRHEMVVMSAKLANGFPLGVAKGWNISWKFPEYFKHLVIFGGLFWDFFFLHFQKILESFQKFTGKCLPLCNPSCHCNEMGITILPINQVWKHINRVCSAQSLPFVNEDECHKPKKQLVQQCCIKTFIVVQYIYLNCEHLQDDIV